MDEQKSHSAQLQLATLGGGCFWCTEAVFSRMKGVKEVVCGYAGGTVENPTYELVCTDTTGHAEVVQILYNPEEISFRELLDVFFTIHDPTTPDRQGADYGSQYRSIILYHTEEQRRIAEHYIQELEREGIYDDRIVTQVVPFNSFYRAEEYHQHYFEKNPEKAYCRLVVKPKVQKAGKKYGNLIRNSAID